ncbi:hypothetical protein Tco_1551230 [Tanacetum coccineum]
MLTQGNQASGMIKSEFGGMTEKDIENMTIVEYMKYEAEMNKRSKRGAQSYFPTRYEDTDIGFFHHDKSRVLDYLHDSDDAKIDAYYDLPLLLHCFKYVQPHTEYRYEPFKEDNDCISDDESETSKQRMINHTDDYKPYTPKPQPEDGELSSEEDLDDWLKIEMEKHMCGQDKENEEDALVAILKTLVGECKAVYANKDTQIETSLAGTNEVQGVFLQLHLLFYTCSRILRLRSFSYY